MMKTAQSLFSRSPRRNAEGGYTLLFAVITAALVLGVAVFILSISTKQYELSASARNSVYSFYAADAGIECAALAYSTGNISVAVGAKISCNGATISGVSFVGASPGYPPALVSNVKQTAPDALNFSLGEGTCVSILIYDGNDSNGNHYTVVDSRGYNHCTASFGPDKANPSTVERALRLSYKS